MNFVDLNCGCPTHEVTEKGFESLVVVETGKVGEIGGRIGEGGCFLPLSVKIKLSVEDDKPALKLAEIENAGASV